MEYRSAGYQDVGIWIEASRSAIRTQTAQRIAAAALTVTPLAWRGR